MKKRWKSVLYIVFAVVIACVTMQCASAESSPPAQQLDHKQADSRSQSDLTRAKYCPNSIKNAGKSREIYYVKDKQDGLLRPCLR